MQKSHLLIFDSFLDIRENAEWPCFSDPPCTSVTVNDMKFERLSSVPTRGTVHWPV